MLTGTMTALVTPFQKDGSLDKETLFRIVELQIKAGISGLVPLGTTGESATLTIEEKIDLLETVVSQVRGKIPVIVGAGANDTRTAIEMTKIARAKGASATLQVTPYYNKPTQEGLYQHFMAIADAVDLPIILYDVPGRTALPLDVETIIRLSVHPRIHGVKDASGSVEKMMTIVQRRPKGFSILCGDDNLTLPSVLLGSEGVISVASNLFPARVVAMVEAATRGDVMEARRLHYALLPFFEALFFETNPIPIKTMMAMKGWLQEGFRLPLCSCLEATRERLATVLKDQEAGLVS